MRERRWLLLTLYGLLIALAVSDALKATRPKFKIATTSTTSTTTEEPAAAESADDEVEATTLAPNDTNATTGHTLTGIPQIDYIWDPNLPRELNGYNLSDYPFYASMPEDIDFKCDGLHDGFYASVPHKCQVYHHCLFGTRYDFLCANFTAFDQKTFICHFVSEVDCANSKKYWHRNDALYKAATTTTTSTTTTSTTTTTTTPSSAPEKVAPARGDRDSLLGRRRRPLPPPRRPVYDYYEDEYYDDEYDRPRGPNRRDYDDYDDRKYRRDRYRHRDFRDRFPMRREPPIRPRDPVEDEPVRTRVRDQDPSRTRDVEDRVRDGDDRRFRDDYDEKDSGSASASGSSEGQPKPVGPPASLFARPRNPPPKLQQRRPVPLSEPEKYVYSVSTTARALIDEPRRRPSIPLDDMEEPRRRPQVDDLEELPRPRRPMSDSLEEPRRRPIMMDSSEDMQPRRRPLPELLDDDDYYEDELDDIRPRWQMRGRPLRERDFADKRYRDRPFRSRYRDEEEDVRPRKQHPERSRDRFYDRDRERSRDRSLTDRTKDRERPTSGARAQELDKPDRSIYNREGDRPRSPLTRPKEPAQDSLNEPTKKPSVYDRSTTEKHTTTTSSTTTTTTTAKSTPSTTTTTEEPEIESIDSPQNEDSSLQKDPNRAQKYSYITVTPKQQQETIQHLTQKQSYYNKAQEPVTEKDLSQKYWKPNPPPPPPPPAPLDTPVRDSKEQEPAIEDYPSEYYDEVEEPAIVPIPPPRPTVRVIKRPFLPSRGGNPNPRGLSPVGSKALPFPRRDETPAKTYVKPQTTTNIPPYSNEDLNTKSYHDDYQTKARPYDNKQNYNNNNNNNNYKSVQQPELVPQKPQQQPINENYDRLAVRRPEPEIPKRRPEIIPEVPISHKSQAPSWSPDYSNINEQNNEANNQAFEQPNRGSIRHENSNLYTSPYKTDDVQEQLGGINNNNFKAKQKFNEVTHHNLQDIPESEYDVTLNEALTPNLSQEPNLPSGFVLPLHRQFNRDALLQPSENNYKFSRPVNNQQQQQQQKQQQPQQQQQSPSQQQQQHQHQQQQQSQQQNTYIPSTQYQQQTPAISPRNSDASKTVYYRTPETIQISGSQYRQQRGHWGDYTGF